MRVDLVCQSITVGRGPFLGAGQSRGQWAVVSRNEIRALACRHLDITKWPEQSSECRFRFGAEFRGTNTPTDPHDYEGLDYLTVWIGQVRSRAMERASLPRACIDNWASAAFCPSVRAHGATPARMVTNPWSLAQSCCFWQGSPSRSGKAKCKAEPCFNPYWHGAMLELAREKGITAAYYAYIIAFLAKARMGLYDCDVGEPSLCRRGGERCWIARVGRNASRASSRRSLFSLQAWCRLHPPERTDHLGNV